MSSEPATLVLVHGAWHGRWCWERLTPLLERRGVPWRTVDLPSVQAPRSRSADAPPGLPEDAEAVRAALAGLAGPIVLCGHSYGGMVISLAATAQSHVTRLVYLAAYMPEPGQSLVVAGGSRHAPWIQMLEGGFTLPDLGRAGEVFYGDCDASTQQWALERLKAQHSSAFAAPVAQPAWREIPSTYVVCSADAAISPMRQRTTFAPRAQRVMEIESSHSPFLSQPEALAEVLVATLAGT